VSGGFDGTVRVWDLRAGEEVHRIPLEHPVYAVAVADDGAILVGTHGGIGVLQLR
jgi:WD40 repeat protein